MGLFMSTDAAVDRVRSELNRAFEKTRADLERIEILAAGLAAFSKPVPAFAAALRARTAVRLERPMLRPAA
jgi:hypothetical protein